MTTRGEIAKLTLYARGKERIEVEDVEAIVADAAPSSLDALIDAALLGDMAALEASARRYFADGGEAGLLVIRLAARLTLLHRLRLEMERGTRRSTPRCRRSTCAFRRRGEPRWPSRPSGGRRRRWASASPRSPRSPRGCAAIRVWRIFWRRARCGRWCRGCARGGEGNRQAPDVGGHSIARRATPWQSWADCPNRALAAYSDCD